MLRVLRVCVLAIDVRGSELKPGKQQPCVITISLENMYIQQFLSCVCVCGALTHRLC